MSTSTPPPVDLLYGDSPYLGSTRKNKRIYRHEMMSPEEHQEYLAAMDDHPGPAAISHYQCGLYDEMLLGRGWAVDTVKTVAEHGKQVVEALYTNPALQALVACARRQPDLFAGACG